MLCCKVNAIQDNSFKQLVRMTQQYDWHIALMPRGVFARFQDSNRFGFASLTQGCCLSSPSAIQVILVPDV